MTASTTRPCVERICQYCGRHFVALEPEPGTAGTGNFYCCYGHLLEELRRPRSGGSTTRRLDA